MKRSKTIQDIVDARSWRLPKADKAQEAIGTFSPTEKAVFALFVAIFIVSAVSLLWKVNNSFLVTVPERGGTLEEGIIGSPRFLNPLLAISDADRDLTSLVYSGLMRATPSGDLVPDLALGYAVSPDGLSYTFTLKDDIYFHDGRPVTSDDVEFTVRKAQDPALKSPKRVNWEGVTVEKISDKEIRFTLREPYAPFIENTTLGILPKHIWQNITSEEFPFSNFNVEPVGSGPYRVKGLKRDSGGIPMYFEFRPFARFTFGEPYVENLVVRFYDNREELMDAYKEGSIQGLHSMTPREADAIRGTAQVREAKLPRIFGLFFNQNQASLFTSKKVRLALDRAIDKERITREIMGGYGEPIDGPIPPGSIAFAPAATSAPASLDEARALLEEEGWKPNPETGILEKEGEGDEMQPLAFSISTSDSPDLKRTAELVAEEWRKIGADVDVQVFELGDLNQNVIRPRRYDVLLFGQIIGRDLDLYPFWHSSQRNDPGLNVAQYANIESDELLERSRATADEGARAEALRAFADIVRTDVPAVFLYSPHFIYALPMDVKGVELGHVVFPADRFSGAYAWYIETNRVWQIFAGTDK